MKNLIQKGDVLDIAAPYDVAGGAGAQVGSIFGVAVATVLSGATVQLMREGLFTLAKTSAQAWGIGDRVFWDNTNKVCTTVPGSNLFIGFATAVAANPSSTGKVLLSQAAGMRIVGGQATTVTAADTIVTGLATVLGAVASMDSDLAADPTGVSCTIGDQAGAPAAGSIIVKTWKTIATPVAATTFNKKVNWLAWGY